MNRISTELLNNIKGTTFYSKVCYFKKEGKIMSAKEQQQVGMRNYITSLFPNDLK